jgi:hypothetical protein
MVMAQEAQQDTVVHRKKSHIKVESINPNQPYRPLPEETKPDFRTESLFKALFSAGMNFSQIDGDNEVGYKKYGANVGAGTVVKFSKLFSVSMELVYSMEGARPHFNSYDNGVKDKYNVTLDYLNIPLSFNIHDKKVVMFGAGIQLGALMRYNQLDSAGNNITAHPTPKNEQPRKLDISGQVAATFFIKRRIGIGVRFSYSFLKIRDALEGSKVLGEYNNVVQFRVSYLLDPKNAKWKSNR